MTQYTKANKKQLFFYEKKFSKLFACKGSMFFIYFVQSNEQKKFLRLEQNACENIFGECITVVALNIGMNRFIKIQ